MKIADRHEFRIPYMVGVYLAANAIPDVFLLTDGPDCLFFKAEFVHGAQDFHSTLLDVTGRHRVAHTLADINNVVLDREDQISALAARLAAEPDAGMVLITAMPMASITGTQYDRIARELSVRTGKLVAEVPARSLQGDWLDGYGQVLAAVARSVPFDGAGSADGNSVAVVGPLIDRTEADRLADVREIRRILQDGLGLDVCSVWPSNATVAELGAVARAGTVISLPYGSRAARILSRRLGVPLVEAPLPFGPSGTGDFTRTVAAALGRNERAEDFLRSEQLEWADSFKRAAASLESTKFIVASDPWLAEGLVRMLKDAGAQVSAAQSTSFDPKPVCGLPTLAEVDDGVDVDMLIVPTRGIDVALRLGRPFFEFGFTSYGTHAFFDAPTLGWPGAVNVMSGIVSARTIFATISGSRTWNLKRLAGSYQVVPDREPAIDRG